MSDPRDEYVDEGGDGTDAALPEDVPTPDPDPEPEQEDPA